MDIKAIEHFDSIYFRKVHPDGVIPKRSTEFSAGFDLYASEDTWIVGGAGNFLVPTSIAVKLPSGTYGRIAMRSGLALNQHLTVSAGVIDRDYTGPIGVLVSSTKIFDIKNILEFYDTSNESNDSFDSLKLDDKSSTNDNSSIVKANLEQLSFTPSDITKILTPHVYLIKKGERFAQLVIERVCYSPGVEVLLIENNGVEHIGFGSTGTA